MSKIPRLLTPEEVIKVKRVDSIGIKVKVKTILNDIEFEIAADEAMELRDQLDKAIWGDDSERQLGV
jgi:hypothetical protein